MINSADAFKKPKLDVQEKKLAHLLTEMANGDLQVPRFQREFVWPITKTRALLDSMFKEFPIGTFFLWRAPAGSPHLVRPLTELGIPPSAPGSPVSYILDGQQRLTSLYAVVGGVRLGSRNYGRISIDLDVATRYANTDEEGFEEDIFVYHSSDNHRYVSVTDLVSEERHLVIYNGIPEAWQPAFIKAYTRFQTYPFSVVWIEEQALADAINIFQRINQAGQRLSRYDLICANVWSEEFDFRKEVTLQNKEFAQSGFGSLHETIFTQAFSLILHDNCTTAAELSLDTDGIRTSWSKVIQALELAVSFVSANIGVKHANFLPYRGLLPVIAYFFYHSPKSAITAAQRDVLWQYFWRVSLSERYSSTSPMRMAEDAQTLRECLEGKSVTFSYPAKVTTNAVLRTKMTSTTSALRNAILCMLALRGPLNFKDGGPVNLSDDFFSNLKKAERHHIFPVGYLKAKGIAGSRVHLVPNFCFIPSDLNKEIGSKPPSEYLSTYTELNPQFDLAAKSHLLPAEAASAVWEDSFETFLAQRADMIVEELNRLAAGKPADSIVDIQSVEPQELRVLEIQLRDFIDHRLSETVGEYYWKQTMPGDVIVYVKKRIKERIEHHPYETNAQYSTGRARLNFCDMSHYPKIIQKNWTVFEPIFHTKTDLEQYLTNYRVLRNAYAHSRQPNQVEQAMGNAAVMWLRDTIESYEIESAHYDADNGAYFEEEEMLDPVDV